MTSLASVNNCLQKVIVNPALPTRLLTRRQCNTRSLAFHSECSAHAIGGSRQAHHLPNWYQSDIESP